MKNYSSCLLDTLSDSGESSALCTNNTISEQVAQLRNVLNIDVYYYYKRSIWVKNKTLFKSLLTIPVNHHKRTTLKWLGGSLLLASMGANMPSKKQVFTNTSLYQRAINYLGKHQAGLSRQNKKHASFIALDLTVTTPEEVEKKFSER